MDPNEILKNPDQIKSLISILQSLLSASENKPESNEQTKKSAAAPSKPSSTIKTKGRRKVDGNAKIQSKNISSNSVNKFEQMSEFRMHKDDTAIDKKLSVAPPVARMRDFDFIDVICRVCGKTEHIPPALLFDSPSRYKCNNCSTQSG